MICQRKMRNPWSRISTAPSSGINKINKGINGHTPEEENEEEDFVEVNIWRSRLGECQLSSSQIFEVEDEVTGLAVSDDYIVAQFSWSTEIHVFSGANFTLLHRLSGHDYGGQAVQILDHILFLDQRILLWSLRILKSGKQIQSVQDPSGLYTVIFVWRNSTSQLWEKNQFSNRGSADHLINLYLWEFREA